MSTKQPTEPDLDAEREVDIGHYLDALVARWWLPLAGLVVGVALGYLLALGGNQVFRSEATVYVGTPFSPGGGAPVQGLATNPNTVARIARGQETLQTVSSESGMSVRDLRAGVSTRAIRSGVAKTAPNQLYVVSVKGSHKDEVNKATAAIAERVVQGVGGYARLKRKTFQELLASDDRQLAAIDQQMKTVQAELDRRLGLGAADPRHVAPDGGAAARDAGAGPSPGPAAARPRGAGRAAAASSTAAQRPRRPRAARGTRWRSRA